MELLAILLFLSHHLHIYHNLVTISFDIVTRYVKPYGFQFVRRHGTNSNSAAFVWTDFCSNVPEAKHAFSLEETHSDCMLTLPCNISSRQSAVESLAQRSIPNLHSSPFQRLNKGNYLQNQSKRRHIKSLQNRNNSPVIQEKKNPIKTRHV